MAFTVAVIVFTLSTSKKTSNYRFQVSSHVENTVNKNISRVINNTFEC